MKQWELVSEQLEELTVVCLCKNIFKI